jgi:hypothetical protein
MAQLQGAEVLIYKVLWVFTPVMVSIIGWFVIRNVNRIERDIDRNNEHIQDVDHRLTVIESEHRLHHKGK